MTDDGYSIIRLFWSFFQFFVAFEIPGTNVTPAQFMLLGSSVYLFIKLIRRAFVSESTSNKTDRGGNDG